MSKKNSKNKRWQSAYMNDKQFNYYYEQLEQMACAIYRWENLPPAIDVRFLELTLFNRGMALFFWDEEYANYFATQGAPSGHYNMYNNPLEYIAFGANGFHRNLEAKDCVPIWNNYLRRPDINAMQIYARRLADIDRTIDVNLAQQKTPIIVSTPESQRLTVQNLMKQVSGGEPIIIGNDGLMDSIGIDYINIDVPYNVDKLLESKQQVWSEIMTYFGIENTNIAKAERVQAAEVKANNGQINANRLIRLNCRREACKQINMRYGLDVWVDYNIDISSSVYNALASAPALAIGAGVEGVDKV